MKAAPKTRKTSEGPRLSREDWIDAAFKAVVEGGFDNVRVLVLADKLGVTRGSFYWHFADHAELVSDLLKQWRDYQREQDRIARSEIDPDPQKDLERLIEIALRHGGKDLEYMRFELALRGYGRRDAEVAKMLVDVDQERMDMVKEKYMRLTNNDAQKSQELASLFYLAIVGSYQALSRPVNPPMIREYLKSIIANYLVQEQRLDNAKKK